MINDFFQKLSDDRKFRVNEAWADLQRANREYANFPTFENKQRRWYAWTHWKSFSLAKPDGRIVTVPDEIVRKLYVQ